MIERNGRSDVRLQISSRVNGIIIRRVTRVLAAHSSLSEQREFTCSADLPSLCLWLFVLVVWVVDFAFRGRNKLRRTWNSRDLDFLPWCLLP
jgi:hypothetical protein